MKKISPFLTFCVAWVWVSGLVSCNSQKESLSSRGMQNLTARYNILFNARELVKESEQNIQAAYPNNYDRLIPVFTEPDAKMAQSEFKKLDEAILKATKVANEKSQSKFVDEAYLLIGIANHLKADHFNSVEYFNYVFDNYPKEKDVRQAALIWKGRSLMEIKKFEEAQASLDSAIKYLKTSKKLIAEAYASRAQLYIYNRQLPEAANLLSKAIKASKQKSRRIRWTFLLAQLEHQAGNLGPAYKHYSQVVSSNAPFEMAFNANLNRISIDEQQGDQKVNREQRLRALLKDEKNQELADQIYYRIARNFEEEKQLAKAIENYNLSIRKNTQNRDQRGLSYLALAELYFKEADYVRSKKYYDSTLTALPLSHPDYKLIVKKNISLDILAKNLTIIAEEDSMQTLAALPEKERMATLDKMVAEQLKPVAPEKKQSGTEDFGTMGNDPNQKTGDNKFYFNNSAALSQGFSDFKRRWGNRKLEDNWRRSEKSSLEANSGNAKTSGIGDNIPKEADKQTTSAEETLKNTYLFKIPDTPDKLAASNLRIANAYFEVGDYYREVLNQKPEAIAAFETLLKRYPDYVNRAAVYYNLYRLYADLDAKKSEEFKNLILANFPQTPFAKVILDPEFGQKQDEQDLALSRAYNQVFECFAQKEYPAVLTLIEKMDQEFGKNRLSVQLAYLNAIAKGHQTTLTGFEPLLKAIVTNYPQDKLITPLVKQHLAFIDSNRKSIELRLFALLDNDPKTLIWAEDFQTAQELKNNEQPAVVLPNPSTEIKSENGNSLFDLKDQTHFVVIHVKDPTVNLNSSRFGIGQFNRANFPDGNIKHQLKDLNESQLIFVGEFGSKENATEYYQNILPLMRDIMKIPVANYALFIINKSNLDRLNNQDTLNQYLDFYQKNYKL